MNLVADIGNTSTKLALFEGSRKIASGRVNDISGEELDKFLYLNKAERAIVSSVRELPAFVYNLIISRIPSVLILSHKTSLPFKNEYETPETLGPDRIAAIAGALQLFGGKKDVLVIDAGTAVTFDFLSGKTYKGGNISPGVDMRFKALNHFTGKLPLVTAASEYSFPGRNTTDAIAAGVITGVIYEINEYIRTFEEKQPGIKVIISGGDGDMLKDKLDYPVEHIPDIVINGLNYILEYNAL